MFASISKENIENLKYRQKIILTKYHQKPMLLFTFYGYFKFISKILSLFAFFFGTISNGDKCTYHTETLQHFKRLILCTFAV